jgi:glycopeptide antibiotics resistance protein
VDERAAAGWGDVTAARTGTRLARAVLGYYLAVVAVIVLTPFEFVRPDRLGWDWLFDGGDFVANVLLFVPFGFLYRLAHRRGMSGVIGACVAGAAASGAIELVQMWAPQRFASPFDVVANTFGAGLGALICGAVAKRFEAPALVGRLSLELPLMGLLYLLIPLLWVGSLAAGDNVLRVAMLALPVAFGATLLGWAQRHHFGPVHGVSAVGTAAAAAAAVLLGSFPAIAAVPAGVIALAIVAAAMVLRHGLAGAWEAERRFELIALRAGLPFFVVYVAAVAVVPLTDPSTPPGFVATDALDLRTVDILRLLHTAALFTLVGYAFAELRGRLEQPFAATAARLPFVALPAAALVLGAGRLTPFALDWSRGRAAAFVLLVLVTAHYGAWLYHLQRDHVRALIARTPQRRDATGHVPTWDSPPPVP